MLVAGRINHFVTGSGEFVCITHGTAIILRVDIMGYGVNRGLTKGNNVSSLGGHCSKCPPVKNVHKSNRKCQKNNQQQKEQKITGTILGGPRFTPYMYINMVEPCT